MNSNSLGQAPVTPSVSDGRVVPATSWLRRPPSVTDTTKLLGVSPSNSPASPGHHHPHTAWQSLAARAGREFTRSLRLRYGDGDLLPSSSQLGMEVRFPQAKQFKGSLHITPGLALPPSAGTHRPVHFTLTPPEPSPLQVWSPDQQHKHPLEAW